MSSTSVTSDSLTVARANAWHSLAQALRQPREWAGDEPALLEEHFRAFGGELSTKGSAAALAWSRALEDLEICSVAYARLFLGPFEIQAPPYASMYLEPEGKLMGEVSQYVSATFTEAGLAQRSEPRDIPDHICHEMEFMYYLAFQEVNRGGALWAERQQRFWREHLGQWLTRFASSMLQADSHPFYGEMAGLILTFAQSEDAVLGSEIL